MCEATFHVLEKVTYQSINCVSRLNVGNNNWLTILIELIPIYQNGNVIETTAIVHVCYVLIRSCLVNGCKYQRLIAIFYIYAHH